MNHPTQPPPPAPHGNEDGPRRPYLVPCPAPFSLDDLGYRICSSSNFNVAWQFYHFAALNPRSHADLRAALDSVIASPVLHQFLRDTFVTHSKLPFSTRPPHDHARIVHAPDRFENVLASAAADRSGAYSRDLRNATTQEKQEIRHLFSQPGPYEPYELLPGDLPTCPACRDHNNHLFSTWFHGVAWDWCFLATWPAQKLLWIGCLTDTD